MNNKRVVNQHENDLMRMFFLFCALQISLKESYHQDTPDGV